MEPTDVTVTLRAPTPTVPTLANASTHPTRPRTPQVSTVTVSTAPHALCARMAGRPMASANPTIVTASTLTNASSRSTTVTRMLPATTPKVPSPANATRDPSMTNGGERESSATVVLQDASPAPSARLVSTRFSHAPLPPTESAVVTSQLLSSSVVSSITTT